MKKYLKWILAFIIPITIVIICLLLNNYYPFGDKNILFLDGLNQYPGFLSNIIDVIKNNHTILYSFKGLLGFNLFASSIYYVFNLTNIIGLIIPKGNLIDFYTISMVIKFGLSSLTMFTLLNYLNKDNKHNLIFCLCYSLTSYNVLYYLNYMWFDSIIMLPLVIMGIEKIFKDNKYLLYIICLSLSIIMNFYIGYMICVFSLIYFIYKVILTGNKKVVWKFLFSSLMAGLLSSFVLIPIVSELLNGKGALFANQKYFEFDWDGISTFYKLTLGSYSNKDLEYGSPAIYVSLFIYVNTVLFFFNSKIKRKEKIVSGVLILFFLLSMSFNLLDYFWQMLQMPIWYPTRYAFIIDFFLIILAYRNFNNFDKLTIKKLLLIMVIIVIMCSIGFLTAGNLEDTINIPAKLIYLGISLILVIYYLFLMNDKDYRNIIIILLLIELGTNTFLCLRNNGNKNYYLEYSTKYSSNYNTISSIKDDSFYRVSMSKRTITNNGLLFGYNDINYFSSVRNANTFKFLHSYLGMNAYDDCNLKYTFNNPIVNALLDIKYFNTDYTLNYYDKYKDNIYINKDATGIAFGTNKDVLNLKYGNITDNINNLVITINGGDKKIIKEFKYSDKNIECSKDFCIVNGTPGYINYKFKISEDGFIFVNNSSLNSKDETHYKIIINKKEYDSIEVPYFVKKNDEVLLIINPEGVNYKDYDYHVYFIKNNVYNMFITKINENKFNITKMDEDNYIKGNISMDNDGVLFTSIANDKGWKVLVDGKETKVSPILDGLLGVKLSKGKHNVEFIYEVPGLNYGLIFSGVSLLLVCLLGLKRKL